ncbi:hypothetical protein SRABI118_04120 [Massilia sp. Bi118]|uniref:hypothetical protein n=1 Tax=Massilia sp. Bi118 TaxID=2822346 RepID=UPI001D5D8243|nr:hypothetical protein [Massilia sp. Bi118]CAH0292508.1 hypothetical protein SRABI118_04120 [Massilia sp. Bi118]
MKNRLFPLLAICAVLASSLACAEPAALATTTTRLGISATTFSCSGTGSCHYLLLNSLCQERMLDGATKERSCRYTEAARFRLLPGQKKTVANLPADYLYGMKMNGDPSAQDVLNAPVPH